MVSVRSRPSLVTGSRSLPQVAERLRPPATKARRRPAHGIQVSFGLLRPRCDRSKIRAGMLVEGLLICAECGCASDDLSSRWAAFSGEDPDGLEPTSVVIMCPVCAAREFEWRPEAAEGYT